MTRDINNTRLSDGNTLQNESIELIPTHNAIFYKNEEISCKSTIIFTTEKKQKYIHTFSAYINVSKLKNLDDVLEFKKMLKKRVK